VDYAPAFPVPARITVHAVLKRVGRARTSIDASRYAWSVRKRGEWKPPVGRRATTRTWAER